MPAFYTVEADVVDIRRDAPRLTDKLAIDTNVWAWVWYFLSGVTPSGTPIPQLPDYVGYLNRSRVIGGQRYWAPSSMPELAHLIELNELEGFAIGHGSMSLKEYRHNHPTERMRVVQLQQRVWTQVEGDGVELCLTLDAATVRAALALAASAAVDGHDLYLLQAMLANGVTQLLSDDGDFCTVAGITLFTANPRVIAAARAKGKLVVR